MPNFTPTPDAPSFAHFSLRQALLVVLAVAVAMAAWGANDRLWSAALTNINIAMLVASMVIAIYVPGQVRAFCIGFLLGDGLITIAEFIPDLGQPLMRRMLAWQLWHPDAPQGVDGKSIERAYVGALLTGWLYGCAAGTLAMWLQSKAARTRVEPLEA